MSENASAAWRWKRRVSSSCSSFCKRMISAMLSVRNSCMRGHLTGPSSH